MGVADRAQARTPLRARIIDRYIFAGMARPLGVSLAVVLVALLLERVFRLFDLLANRGGTFALVLEMAVNLVPHYLGLALPAAFFISIFVVMARLSGDHELDALRSAGLSIYRIGLPFVWMGVALMALSLVLFGFVQPYSRYAYRAALHAATHAVWDARVAQGAFIDAGRGIVVTADHADPTGRALSGVFVHRRQDGRERATSAASGRLALSPDGTRLLLALEDGVQLQTDEAGETSVLRFESLVLGRDFMLAPPSFRPRGEDEREWTLTELWRERREPDPAVPRALLDAELNARLVRALSLPLLPLLAIPMGLAAKRARRGYGIAVAAVILAVYHHAIQLGESLAGLGRIGPAIGIWGPFAIFAALCFWIFWRADLRPGETPFERLFARLDDVVRTGGRWLPGWGRRR